MNGIPSCRRSIVLALLSIVSGACSSRGGSAISQEGGFVPPSSTDGGEDARPDAVQPGSGTDTRQDAADGAVPISEAGAADGGIPPSSEGGTWPDSGATAPFVWDLPAGFPLPFVSPTSPLSEDKVELGRRLFYDERLSGNQTTSCASCHDQKLAFSDGMARSEGSTGELHPRSSMSLANVAYATTLTWANPLFSELHRQAMIPLFSDDPVEMGLRTQEELETRLRSVSFYVDAFAVAFPGETEPVTLLNVRKALEAFQRTLISGNSAYDRWASGKDPTALDDAALRGLQLFRSDRLGCAKCHSGFNFTDHVYYEGAPGAAMPYHNVGLYNVDGAGAYPEPNTGAYGVTLEPSQMGAFKTPTLRNIDVTSPYMHDGSVTTLGEVIDLFAAGGRNIESGPLAGDGRASPLKDPLVTGFTLTRAERNDLVAFLQSLTDHEFLTNPKFSDPWIEGEK